MAKDGLMETLLIAAGGYLVLKYAFGIDLLAGILGTTAPTTTAGSGTPVSTTSGGSGATTTTTTVTNIAGGVDTIHRVAQAAQAAGTDPTTLQSVDVWNYYYAQVKGIPGPDPSTLGLSNYVSGEKYSIDDWWAAMQSHGFSGIGSIAIGAYNTIYRPPTGRIRGERPSYIEMIPKFLQ